ncbi:hypothetical protein [Roseateles saccharophilus]|uniref:Uncharacterized protein n=1 Tax=Roseateles saccharophilus TaxID=304 RepID=A0A4R3UAQ4_ROSSA|nr:hypothetical protein [Roseateles saccharophilus]MDG0835758.1 hypothetical protein [Roseateles saccharophilus]TCU84470.1 hypothetical protein EV671_105316 [Roseateles saccharophilus]
MTVSPLRLSLTSALLGLALGAQAAPAAPAAVTFDTTPRAGQHQRQHIDMQATIKMRAEAGPDATDEQRAKIAQGAERLAQMGPMQMSMQMQQTLQVGQPDADGWLPLTVGVGMRTGQMKVGGKLVPLPQQQNRELGFVARFNPRDFNFEMQKVEGAPELTELLRAQGNTMVNEALQLSKALSQRPLKVGDSVDVPLTLTLPVPLPGGAGSMGGQVHYTLTRLERGVAYFDLAMDLKADISAPVPTPVAPAAAASAASGPEAASSAPATADAPKTMHVVVSGSGKGHSSLRLADRLPLSNQLAMDMQMTMNIPDNGLMHMDMAMVMSAKGESLARPAAAAKPAAAKKKS